MKFFILLLGISAAFAAQVGPKSFQGYQVLTLDVNNKEQFDILHGLFVGDEGYDFWSHPKLGKVDIMVSPVQFVTLKEIMSNHGIKYTVKIVDVESLVSQEREANARGKNPEGKMSWTAYQRWETVEPFILSLPDLNPNFSVNEIGQTIQGRSIYAVKISTGGSGKRAVLIDALFHAREWISGAVSTWFLNDVATNFDKYEHILNVIDIHVIPFTNVDGYEHSHTNDRMWRKNRRQNTGGCYGIDLNRNFQHYWGGESTSTNPCSDIYIGDTYFSEPESEAVVNYAHEQIAAGVEFEAYMTIHSYGQLWLCPWGHTQNSYPPDFDEIRDLGRDAAAALAAHYGTRYTVDQGADSLYAVGGASDDYMKFYANIKYSYTLELRDTGIYGFLLPPSQIIPTAIETTSGMMKVFERVARLH